jgi:FkbM family methyltransferase
MNRTLFYNFFRRLLLVTGADRVLSLLSQNREADSFIFKILPNHYQYSEKSIRKVKRKGIYYQLNMRDIVEWAIYFGLKEKAQTNLLKLCSEGNTVFDVGTNIGSVLMKIAAKVGEKGKVYGFEPDPINYDKFLKNLSLNKFHNVHANKLGLGDKNGLFKLDIIDPTNRGMNRIVSTDNDVALQNQIQVIRLDDFMEENKIEDVHVIKIDVEGYELKVLKGAAKTLELYHPKLFIELDDTYLKKQGDSVIELIALVTNLKYRIYDAETNDLIGLNYNFSNCHLDIICLPQ